VGGLISTTAVRLKARGNNDLTIGGGNASRRVSPGQLTAAARKTTVLFVNTRSYSMYFQDDWKVNRTSTLSARHEFTQTLS